MYSLGIDIGYSSVKVALIDGEDQIRYARYVLHQGRVKESLKNSHPIWRRRFPWRISVSGR
jgi:activator of 2-hydroxyglutaryl-CoA dehydratase